MDLNTKTCVPCKVGEPRLKNEEFLKYKKEINPNWKIGTTPDKIFREFIFKSFKKAIEFINKVAEVAESQGHHPDIYLHNYKKVTLSLWTHKIGGLHQNDFILASKIDNLLD